MVLEEAEEEAGVEVEVSAAVENWVGSGLAGLPDLRKHVFVLIAEQLFLTDEDYLVSRQDAIIAVPI